MATQRRDGSARGRGHATHSKNVGGYERLATALGAGALLWTGVRRGSWTGLLAGISGAMLAYRSMSGRCPLYARLGIDTTPEGLACGIEVTCAVTIDRQPEAVYRFWRDPEHLPAFADRLCCVASSADGMEDRSHWIMQEKGMKLEWDAEIVEDIPGERLAWRSLPGGSLDIEGEVRFLPAPADLGTELRVRMRFVPPGKRLAMPLAPILRRLARVELGRALHRFKQLMETGEIATNAMRPQTGEATQRKAEEWIREDRATSPRAVHEDYDTGEPMPAPGGISSQVRP